MGEQASLAEKTSDRILSYIEKTGARPGDRIPAEHELSKMLGVGRNTVREAIRALVSRNILEIRRGDGTYVSDKKGVATDPLGLRFLGDRIKVAHDLMQIRFFLEPPIAGLAAENATREDVAALELCCVEFERTALAGEDPVPKDIAFHQKISQCSKNMVMPNLIPIISETIRVYTDIRDGHEMKTTLDSHKQIFEAIRGSSSTAAHDAMLIHLAFNRNKLAMAMKREALRER